MLSKFDWFITGLGLGIVLTFWFMIYNINHDACIMTGKYAKANFICEKLK